MGHNLINQEYRILLGTEFDSPFYSAPENRQFVEEILGLCRNGINFYKIESMVIESRWDFHSNAEQKLWQDVLKYKVSHKVTSDTVIYT